MAKDYTSIADTALAMVKKYGRSMTITKFDQSAGDPAKPWEGASDPRGVGKTSLTIYAVAVSVTSAIQVGLVTKDDDMVKRSEQILIVAPGSVEQTDLGNFNIVSDGSVEWKVAGVDKMQPSNLILLYYIGVKR